MTRYAFNVIVEEDELDEFTAQFPELDVQLLEGIGYLFTVGFVDQDTEAVAFKMRWNRCVRRFDKWLELSQIHAK